MKKSLLFLMSVLSGIPSFAQVERSVIVEHFTNTLCGICASKNPAFFDLLEENPEVIHIAYHPSAPYPACIFSQHNVSGNDDRTNFYGVYGGTPRAVLQGSPLPPSTPLVSQEQLDGKIGELSDFSIGVQQYPSGNNETIVTITVERVSGSGTADMMLYVALIEQLINYEAPNGENEHHNVFRKALPEHIIVLSNADDSVIISESYVPDAIWNNDEIRAVAILQHSTDKTILQAARSDFPNSVGEVKKSVDLSGAFFPNPVSSNLHFEPAAVKQFQKVRLYNLFGVQVAESGLQGPLDMQSMAPGYYFLVFEDQTGQAFTTRVIRSSN